MSDIIIINANVEAVASRKDMTMKLTFGTQELKEGGKLFGLQNKMVSLGISTNDLTDSEAKLLGDNKFPVNQVPNVKSKSKRLRNTLFVLWQQGEQKETSDENYDRIMEGLIEFYKSKLD